MHRYRGRDIGLAISAAALAGYVDAIGFLSLGGFFVSFMSGNSTRLAVGLAGAPADALAAGRLIAAFVLGVIVGSLLGGVAGRMRRPVILALVGALLALGAAMAGLGWIGPAMILVAAAMGMENTTFERDGEVSIGLTYLTGSLVKLGQRLAGAITGGPRYAWVPYALLWAGLAGGAIAGARAFPALGLAALWPGVAGAFLLAFIAWRIALSEAREVPPAS